MKLGRIQASRLIISQSAFGRNAWPLIPRFSAPKSSPLLNIHAAFNDSVAA